MMFPYVDFLAIFSFFCVAVLAQDNVLDVLTISPELSKFASAVAAAPAVVKTLSETDPLTLFAPSNLAFEKLDSRTYANLFTPEYVAHLTNLLRFHVAKGETKISDFTSSRNLTMANNETITLSKSGSTILLMPLIGESSVIVDSADKTVLNGVIHTINEVLLPKWAFTNLIGLMDQLQWKGFDTFFRLLFSLMLDLKDSSLLDGLKVTIFAPTDDAFANAAADVQHLLENPTANKKALTRLVSAHIALGRLIPTGNIYSGEIVSTLNGEWQLTINGESHKVADATITSPDLLAVDTVIHGINKVLPVVLYDEALPEESKPNATDEPNSKDLSTSEVPWITIVIAVVVIAFFCWIGYLLLECVKIHALSIKERKIIAISTECKEKFQQIMHSS